ncbi:hypothetical protein GTY80_10850 [Amycolatopsis sp. SID8362]|nr:hypothetical protein [Amycolatopsis sp. SID8362]
MSTTSKARYGGNSRSAVMPSSPVRHHRVWFGRAGELSAFHTVTRSTGPAEYAAEAVPRGRIPAPAGGDCVAEEETANVISGEVSGQAVQVGTVQGNMYVGVPRPAPRVAVEPPAGWDELPELPAKIVSLLRAQIENAEIMPYRLRGARTTSLATVYVRQDVTTRTEVESADQRPPLPALDSKGQLIDVSYPPVARLTVRPPSRSMPDALDGGDHMLVTGGPGQGKSTLSLRLAADVARRWLGARDAPPLAEPVLPLRLTARELATRLDLPFYEALAETVRGEYGALLSQPLHSDDLQHRAAGCRWLLLVDGLDEVADTAVRDRLVAALATAASDANAAYRVVLTTRPIEGATLAPFQRIGAARYELLPFDEEAFRLFAENWFADSGDAAKTFVRQIRDAHLDELVRVPLLATIAAIIFEKYADRPLPDNQYELYESYLGYLRTAHDAPPGPFDEHSGPILEHLGRIRLEEDTSLAAAACRWVAEYLPELVQEPGWEDQLVLHLGSVGPFHRRDGDLRFLHHSFAEHLAATAKARRLPAVFDPAHQDFVDLLHAAEPDEHGRYARRVMLHHTRLRPAEADQLIRFLHAGGPDRQLLAARLLARHAPASREVVDAFLATAREWSLTNQYPGKAILSRVSRAVHHPGLVKWLRELMGDDGVPWHSRVEAAVALATRLGSDARAEAVSVLRLVVNDEAIPVRCRLDAAEALSQCGAEERDVAVLGLRSVLDTPSVTSTQYSDAAVVLAGLGDEARERAIGALIELLDDPTATDFDLAVAAAGLVEIDARFHERCAAVFRKVLRRRSWSVDGVEKAAVGLASLGPDHLDEAAGALELRITDPWLHCSDRFQAARVLLQLGPQHRLRATELVFALTAQTVGGEFDRSYIASLLARCGPEFHEPAAALLRLVLDDPTASPARLESAGRTLISLGPAFHPQAVRALTRAVAHPLAGTASRIGALGSLVALGEPHAGPAADELRSAMDDPEATSETRWRVAAELSRLGPEYHLVAVDQFRRLVDTPGLPKSRVQAWRNLKKLRPEVSFRASAAVPTLVGAAEWDSDPEQVALNVSDVEAPDALADELRRIFLDAGRNLRRRTDAGADLMRIGRRYHAEVVRGFAQLIRDGEIPDSEMVGIARTCGSASAAARAVLSEAFREVLFDERSRPERISIAANAMDTLDAVKDPEVVARLSSLAADASVDAAARAQTITLLLRNEVIRPAEASALVFGLQEELDVFAWDSRVRELSSRGVDVAAGLRAMVGDPDVTCYPRQRAARALADLRPESRVAATAELRSQAADSYLHLTFRTSAMVNLAVADPGAAQEVSEDLRATMLDERQAVGDRCSAAYQLALLNRAAGNQVRRTLLRLAVHPALTERERADALTWLEYFRPEDPVEAGIALALVRDPASSDDTRVSLLSQLPAADRAEAERALVFDRLSSPKSWSGEVNRWNNLPLALEAEQFLREEVTAPESEPGDRIAAAIALSKMSPRHEAESVEHLAALSRGRTAVRRARRELTSLSPEWHARVLADAQEIVADDTRSPRDRVDAGLLVAELTSEVSKELRAQLDELLAEGRIAPRSRVRVLDELGRWDDLRAIRDDVRESPAIRRFAGSMLRDYSSADRVASAELLRAIAKAPSCHPRLRWWAADDLATEYGVRGRELGTAALREIAEDAALPVTARRDAARALGLVRPDWRAEMLELLRRLLATPIPAARVRIWDAIGEFEPGEGALGLLGMARDRACSPAVRCRSAWSVAYLHHDHREAAAMVAREIAQDAEVAWHIRISAARLLARASELCRPEARELIERLQAAGPNRRR